MSKNIFFTKFSELSGERFDAPFFDSKHIENINKIQQVNNTKLSNIVKFSSESWNQKDYFDNEFPYVEISEIDLQTGNINNIKNVPKNEAPSRAKMIVRHNDIIISTTRPTRGAISLIKTDDILIASTGFAVIRTYSDKIKKEYLFNCLKMPIILNQFEQRSSGGNYPAITLEELSKVIIPLPSLEIQNQIISIMDSAYILKTKKEQEAKEKLASIDKYLLSELGIEFQEKEKETLEQRVFTRKFSEVSSNRFDSQFNSNNIYKDINSKYPIEIFKNINESIQTGLPIRKDCREVEGKYPYYGANGIIGYMNEYTHDGEYLVIGQDGYIGNHYVVNEKFWASNHNWVIKIKDGIDIYYVKYFLDVWNYDYLITGGVIPKITKDAVNTINIPLPPIDIQNKIVAYIQALRDEAKALEKEAKEVYGNAKKEVEAIILQSDKNEERLSFTKS